MDDSPPSLTANDFRKPRLHHCPFEDKSIARDRAEILGSGLDGFVWRVFFGNKGPFALKVFYDTDPEECDGRNFADQRECQNAAVLQMVQASVAKTSKEEDDGGPRPVLVAATPLLEREAMGNLIGFADDIRPTRGIPAGAAEGSVLRVKEVPRFTQCFGWLRFNMAVAIRKMPANVRPYATHIDKIRRGLDPFRAEPYLAVVYEYIEDGPNDPETVERVDRFLYQAGFSHCVTPLARNWRRGILVDHSDYMLPRKFGWYKSQYGPWTASLILG